MTTVSPQPGVAGVSGLAPSAGSPILGHYGRYALLEKIGEGGMAEVWRAKTLGAAGFTKDLVIKRLLPQLSRDPVLVQLFVAEARLAARLQHANIVTVFDFDQASDGELSTYYLAQELVEGCDLRQLEREGARLGRWPSVGASVYLAVEVLTALAYAHAAEEHGRPLGLVHRDVSPHNILLSGAGEVKLTDFGIAKVAARASQTLNGVVRGKLSYMSPEHVSGVAVDARTDIYSLGVVLWELITERRLFAGGDDGEVLRRVRDGVVPAPRRLRPELPEDLEQVVLRMLAADRRQRIASAQEAAQALRGLPCYRYAAEELGALVRELFPRENRNWTQVLQSMISEPEPSAAALAGPRSKSDMASSDQKTQMAELPPEVAARMGGSPVAQVPGDARTIIAGIANPLPPAAAAQAGGLPRTIMAEAPQLPQAQDMNRTILAGPGGPGAGVPQHGGQARTMMAEAPQLPRGPGGGFGAPPPSASNAQQVAPGGFAQGLPPPGLPGQTPGPGPAQSNYGGQATVLMDPNMRAPRPTPANPAVLRPAAEVFAGAGGGESAGSPAYVRWIVGPAIALVLALATTFTSNRIWPPAIGSGPGGIMVPKGIVRVLSTPSGAKVLVNGQPIDDLTPAVVRGKVGDKAQLRIVYPGYEPEDRAVFFASDDRSPVNVTLVKVGMRGAKTQDPSTFENKPGVITKEDPEEVAEREKAAAAEREKEALAAKEKAEAEAAEKEKAEAAAEEEGGRKGKHRRGSRDKGEAREDKGEKTETASKPTGAKGTLTVLVRPWAVVFIDGKRIKQTPLRDYSLSAGKHTVLLVNENKGKRESITVDAKASANTSINRTWE